MQHSTPHLSTALTALLLALLLSSCGSSEEVRTIEEGPRSITERVSDTTATDDNFMELSVGILDPADNFDPLFADNLSTMRINSLLYDGLFTLTKDGSPESALVNETSVSDDSLTYTFSLNSSLFYHDNSAFLSGVGRRLQAADVKWAFERTASADVPPKVSRLLMNINGYEEFYLDQRHTYDPDRRALRGVSGIEVLGPHIIRFTLKEPDPDFTTKLASPYLFIYPREAIKTDGSTLKSNPVGTGAYQLNSHTESSAVLTRAVSDGSDNRLTNPVLDRIEFIYSDDEGDLFQNYARGDTQWLPEIGPEAKRVAVNNQDELAVSYRENYELTSAGHRSVYFYIQDSQLTQTGWLIDRLSDFNADSLDTVDSLAVLNPLPEPNRESASEPNEVYLAAFSTDFFTRTLLSKIQHQYLGEEASLRLSSLRVPGPTSSIYTISTDSYHEKRIPVDPEPWMHLVSTVHGLHYQEIQGIGSHRVPWKLFVEEIRVVETGREN